MVRLLLCSAALLMLLGACSPKETVVDRPVAIVTYVPAELRQCPALPPVPSAEAKQSNVSVYVSRLHQVAVTCKTKLGAVDNILTAAENPPAGG